MLAKLLCRQVDRIHPIGNPGRKFYLDNGSDILSGGIPSKTGNRASWSVGQPASTRTEIITRLLIYLFFAFLILLR